MRVDSGDEPGAHGTKTLCSRTPRKALMLSGDAAHEPSRVQSASGEGDVQRARVGRASGYEGARDLRIARAAARPRHIASAAYHAGSSASALAHRHRWHETASEGQSRPRLGAHTAAGSLHLPPQTTVWQALREEGRGVPASRSTKTRSCGTCAHARRPPCSPRVRPRRRAS